MQQPRATNRLSTDPPKPAEDGHRAAEVQTRRVAARTGSERSRERAEGASLELTPPEQQYLSRALTDLTAREREVLFAICGGGTNEILADRLCIALPTLRTHLMRLNQKLGSTSKGDVVRFVSSRLLEGYRTGRIQ